GFFHIDLKENVEPKLRLLQEFGFYPVPEGEEDPRPRSREGMSPCSGAAAESCGAHSPRIEPHELATRTGRGEG
ncbi:hypothetical protein HQ576_20675, partial [bacterium]|nr:hypothetical protein [bacterium]